MHFKSLCNKAFSGAYTKSKISKNANKRYEFLRWWGVAFILGALLFEFIPDYLDANFLINNNLTPHLFLISFIFFINIHHYFIDSVIWKAGNKDIRDNLNFITR
ncbi:hypothetical protein [Acinetobacter towneri]|uniref:hypothetical protein n=1 Tax=Acinetobacter towneri TaxID=202956 RepID=UPI0012B0F033|nr:hypothetical protein [Acinetobacter towneri]